MVKVIKSSRKQPLERWEIMVGGESHGYCKGKINSQRLAVDKINSIIRELEDDRKRLTDEILAAT